MQITYLILCHKNPGQVACLIGRLNNSNVRFVVHVDRRAWNVAEGLKDLVGSLPNVTFTKRYRCYWGQFGIVRATLACIDEALKRPFDYAVLLSGQDYPVRPHGELVEFLAAQGGEFIQAFSLRKPNIWTGMGGPYRASYRASGFSIGFRSKVFHTKWLREFPLGHEPHGGSQWWCLSREALTYVAQFLKDHPSYRRFFWFTYIPDEIIFQSILANSTLAPKMRQSLTYVDWSPPKPPYPKTLDETDLPSIRSGNWFFARKTEPGTSRLLCEALDAELGVQPQT